MGLLSANTVYMLMIFLLLITVIFRSNIPINVMAKRVRGIDSLMQITVKQTSRRFQ